MDGQFEALASPHRRRLLAALVEENPQPAFPSPITEGYSPAHKQAQVALLHNHLPKLEDLGYIDWDKQTNQVTKGPQFDEIRPLLTLLIDNLDGFRDEETTR